MVVSGAPVPKLQDHAGEIALTSLALMYITRNYTIKHLPNRRLEIRIGVHSGTHCGNLSYTLTGF